jgi:serine/threonine protein kinase
MIDDNGKAILCDFGLTRIKTDVTSRTVQADARSVVGSRNWMAPERLLGGLLKAPCDIYAFGMMLYEVSSGHPSFAASLSHLFTRSTQMRYR